MCMKIPKDLKKDTDITDDEWDKVHLPYQDNLDNLMVKYIIPEVVAFAIANSYYRGCLVEATFEQHYKTMTDIILITTELKNVKSAIVDLLHIKYNLTVVNENPLTLKKWQ